MVAKLQCAIKKYWDDHDEYQNRSEYTKNEFLYIEQILLLKEDPIAFSFENARNAGLLAKQEVEYANKFQMIVDENQKFAVTMLDLCKTQAEAELIMSIPSKNKLDSKNKLEEWDEGSQFPRLELAITTKAPNTNIHGQESRSILSN